MNKLITTKEKSPLKQAMKSAELSATNLAQIIDRMRYASMALRLLRAYYPIRGLC